MTPSEPPRRAAPAPEAHTAAAPHFARARRDGYALGSFNAVNLESAQAVVAAAEAERSPVLLAFSENAARYGGFEALAAIGRELRRAATVPVLLHFDHAESPERAHRALDLGFDVVMLESVGGGGGLAALRDLAAAAAERGALVEVEADITAKGERRGDGPRTSPAEIARLARDTGCGLVAVDLGSEHKRRSKTTRLDLAHLRAVTAATEAVVVLHGASGVGEDELRRAVAAGLGKVNVGTELMLAFTSAVRERLADGDLYDLRSYLGAGREAMRERVRSLMRVLGSSGRADPSPR